MPAFQIGENRCQLCFGEVGMLDYCFVCPATRDACSLGPPPPKAEALFKKLSANKCSILTTGGVVFLKVPAPPIRHQASSKWHRPPDWNSPDLADAIATVPCCMAASDRAEPQGLEISVVSTSGAILAFGSGRPPARCSTAAAAQAWALLASSLI